MEAYGVGGRSTTDSRRDYNGGGYKYLDYVFTLGWGEKVTPEPQVSVSTIEKWIRGQMIVKLWKMQRRWTRLTEMEIDKS